MGTAPDAIKRLIDHFDRQSDQVRSPDYNEAQLRIDFINPMFRELGWDVDNTQGFAEQYREVVYEDRLKVGGATKAPDYSFRIGGPRKFFLEAKKPSVNLKESVEPAYQLRRYGWSAKLAVSLLTDFEEFAVYDCRIQPKQLDKASTARREYITYHQYDDRWDFISGTFSKQAVMHGDFDRYCGSSRGKGAQEFDEAFLAEIEEWRLKLASNLAIRNEAIDERSLNFAVQRIIDRIIFLRICEDRGIERVGRLQALLNGPDVYPRLVRLFEDADARYNSGLFHFKAEKGRDESPDELTPGLDVDDASLKSIITRLYYPASPYEFTVVSADILGSVYERFLGKVITLTAGHRAKVEEKPEVRKAGGVYYTPTYIVDYIVQQTVGKLLENKTPKEAAKLTILDPACGSGSFLLGAYQFLLDWHLKWYIADGAENWSKSKKATVRPGIDGQWRLAINERKRILLDNIHGVDIDYQAVEVTKLSLLLKVLEGETAETLGGLWTVSHERALPDLGRNIQCGNSLIGTDIVGMDAWREMSEDEHRHINIFDFARGFGRSTKGGGFDAVIGNPPYIRMEEFKSLKTYLRENYSSHGERSDLYAYFMERGHRLLKNGGRFGMIVSNKFLRANYGRPLRATLSALGRIESVVDFAGLPVFPDATVRTLVLLAVRGDSSVVPTNYCPPPSIPRFDAIRLGLGSVGVNVEETSYPVDIQQSSDAVWGFSRAETASILHRLGESHRGLGEVVSGQIYMGVKSGLTAAFVIDRETRETLIAKDARSAEIIKPVLNGRDIRRFQIDQPPTYLIYTTHGVAIDQYPEIEKYLRKFRPQLERRATSQEWYELQQPQERFAGFMERPKIVFPDMAIAPRFALDNEGNYGTNTVYFIPHPDKYLLGILNSKLAFFIFRQKCAGLEGPGETYLRFFGQYLETFPVTEPVQSERDKVASLVERMIRLRDNASKTRVPQIREQAIREIDAIDRQIDEIVYELYALSESEIQIVEAEI